MNIIRGCVVVLSALFGIMLIGCAISEVNKDNVPGFVGMIVMALTYFAGVMIILFCSLGKTL